MRKSTSHSITLFALILIILWGIPTDYEVYAQTETTIFAVIGDYGLAGPPEADVANLVKSWNPDFIVTVGDNNYPRGSADSIDQNIGQYYHDFIYPYKGIYGNGSPTKRFFPALGNHDWSTGTPNAYYSYFGFYNQRGYYEFVQGPIHFFVLDSDPNEPDGTSSTSKQAKWLKNSLAASTSPFNVVLLHHAPYSSGKHGPTTYMQWPYKDWGADAVLAGHDHIYERLLINGLPYFVNGIGGAELYEYGTILSESWARFNSDFGAMRVEATSTMMKFQMITRAGVLVDEYVIGQIYPETTAIARNNPNPTNAGMVEYTVTFSEAVTGLEITDFLLSPVGINDASITNVSGAGTSYTVSINPGNGEGNVKLVLVDNDSIINSSGYPLGGTGVGNGDYTDGEIYAIDRVSPALLEIAKASADPTNASSVDYLVSFSEPVTGVDGSDFNIFTSNPVGAFISNISGYGTSFIVSINTGVGDTSLRLDLAANPTITDLLGNTVNNNRPNGQTYTVDRNSPSIISILRAGTTNTNANTVDFIVTFSELVAGVDATDFALTSSGINGTYIANIADNNPFYIVTVNTGSGDGTLRLDLIDNDSIVDDIGSSLGNTGASNGSFTNGETFTIDRTPPLATSIIRASANPSPAASVDFIVTFSETVSGVDPGDFIVATESNGAFINNIVDANPFFVISVNTGNGTGSLRLDLAADGSIKDPTGNLLQTPFANGETYTLEKTAVNFPAPAIVEPRRNLLTNNPKFIFSWSPVRNARAYEIFIARDPDFSQLIFNQTLSITGFSVGNPFADGTYYLKIRAYNKDLQPGKFSPVQSFTVDTTPPSTPELVSPPDHSTSPKRPWLQWTTIGDAVQYQIEMDNNINFSSPEFSSIEKNAYVRAKSVAGGTYYWHVRAKDAAGNWSTWSASFVIQFP